MEQDAGENSQSHLQANENNKSGRRGSNPRRPAWEIGVQLKTKNNGAYGLHFESMNSPKMPGSGLEAALNDVGMM
jgi:hypothetical protein